MNAAHERALDRLAEILRKEPLTALAISKRMKCCKPTAYARLEALKRRGEPVVETRQRSGRTGPAAIEYSIR